ncbi:lipoprotein-releasing system permease protein [Soonwooa buanensis]|uniref:Lipoprotein-releasing system permease protein n=1 Tax=Soonwooa buanensis TaxID=619805 RepID=A0A1T5EWL1_9FLAO|nr:FtsX-like permease family protein [Soonwooa buanensis]SKB88248.1 lipoprotein-releasing system permease protein [Soonwooa buanensis]
MRNNPLYIASRYITAKKGSHAVTFITWLAAFAMMIAVASMFVIVSVFSALEDINSDMIANLHADLTIKSKNGKTLTNIKDINSLLKSNTNVESFSKIIEEKVYINYKDNGEIAYLRGVDSAYTLVNPINKTVLYGTYPSFEYSNEVLMEGQLDNRLAIPVNSSQDFATIYMPKAGKGIIQQEDDIFNRKEIYVTGIFPSNDQLNNYIIAPIELSQQLLNLPKDAAYQVVIKLKNPDLADQVKLSLLNQLKNTVEISTKSEENAAFWKMINTEKLMIYLIFSLVIFITTFNLAGAVIILQLDKAPQAKTLRSLGFTQKDLNTTYFNTGLLIVVIGVILGLVVGTILCFVQIQTNFFMAGENLPFPVKITLFNYAIVSAVGLSFGLLVAYIFSRKLKR